MATSWNKDQCDTWKKIAGTLYEVKQKIDVKYHQEIIIIT